MLQCEVQGQKFMALIIQNIISVIWSQNGWFLTCQHQIMCCGLKYGGFHLENGDTGLLSHHNSPWDYQVIDWLSWWKYNGLPIMSFYVVLLCSL